jgi:hypothetical protein
MKLTRSAQPRTDAALAAYLGVGRTGQPSGAMTDTGTAVRTIGEPLTVKVMFALVVLSNVLWYLAKFMLRRRGYPVSWFSGHWHDLTNLWRASCDEQDEFARTNMRAVLGALVMCLIGLVVLAFRL